MSGYHDDPHPPGYVDVGGSSFGSPADSWRNQSSRPLEHRPTQRPRTIVDERGTDVNTSTSTEPTTASHTPGPWAAFPYDDAVDGWYVVGEGDKVAEVVEADGGADVACAWTEANARLIAAAPELLAACEDALSILIDPAQFADDIPNAIERLYELTAYAKGQS